jgi:hypothetical protein
MKKRLLVSFGACALFAAATAAAQGTKWHPGHYAMLGRNNTHEHTMQIAQLSNDTAITGFFVSFSWHTLEPAFNQYDFSLIDSYLSQLRQLNTTKRLVVRIMDRRFGSDDPTAIVPEYLRVDPAYNGGIVRTRPGHAARLWEAPVMDRLISIYQALAQRYDSDPLFEGAFTEESTLGFPAPNFPPGYSHDLLAEQYVRFMKAVKPLMPTSNLFFNANFIGSPTIMSDLFQEMRNASVGAGGQNVSFGSPTQGQRALMGEFGADYRLELPIAHAVEAVELSGSRGNVTPQQIATYAYDVLHNHYLFWARNASQGAEGQQWWTGVLPYLRRSRPPVQTRCPNVYGICVSDDVPVDPQNQRPIVSAGADMSSLPQVAVSLAGSVTDDGEPGPLVSIGWAQMAGPQPAVFADPASPTSQVSFPLAGTYVLRLTASDGELSASDDLTATVTSAPAPPPPPTPVPTPTNQVPQVSAGADLSIELPTASVTLVGAATDDGVPAAELSLEWSQVSGPAAVALDAADAASTVATFSAAGVYVLRLAADDGALSASDEITVTVKSAQPSSNESGVDGGAAGAPPPPVNPAPAPAASSASSGGGGSLGLLEFLLLGVIVLGRRFAAGGTSRE